MEISPTRGPGGTGLGLAISKRFVELHGGHIWASSEGMPGGGSTFAFALPIQPEEDLAEDTRPDDLSHPWRLPAPPAPPAVVVMDDDPAIVKLFRRRLDGYQVAGAATQDEAIARAAKLRAHAIIAELPDPEHLSHWHQDWSRLAARQGTRVVGCPMPSGRRVARTLGLVDYLVKPVTREALLESVERVAPLARTILVVDDQREMVRLLCRMLRSSSHGYRLLRAYDGQRALELVAANRPDLVLLDLLMPQMDGLTMLEKLRMDSVLAAIPVVAISARGVVEAISPSTARTIVVIGDEALPVNRLIHSVQVALDALPPVGAQDSPAEQAPPAEPGE